MGEKLIESADGGLHPAVYKKPDDEWMKVMVSTTDES